MNLNLEALSINELDSLLINKGNEYDVTVSALKKEIADIRAVRDGKAASASAAKKVDEMSPTEKKIAAKLLAKE